MELHDSHIFTLNQASDKEGENVWSNNSIQLKQLIQHKIGRPLREAHSDSPTATATPRRPPLNLGRVLKATQFRHLSRRPDCSREHWRRRRGVDDGEDERSVKDDQHGGLLIYRDTSVHCHRSCGRGHGPLFIHVNDRLYASEGGATIRIGKIHASY